MKRLTEFIWPAIGVAALVVSIWLLDQQFRGQAIGPKVLADLKTIPLPQYGLAILATLVAYAALAWYDRIALMHLGVTHISWRFIALCSFTTYALAHNIGASVVSGAVVRYRAYSTKGLSTTQIALLVGICSLTFVLGVLFLGGIVLVAEPLQLRRLGHLLPHVITQPETARVIGLICLGLVAAYIIGSALRLKPLVIGRLRIEYPHPDIALRQVAASSAELMGASGIIYFALPQHANPGYFVILGVFIASFSIALASESPGGLGVFELLFIKAMPAVPHDKVLTALLVFRLLYLVLPLIFAGVVVLVFERRRLSEALHADDMPATASGDSRVESEKAKTESTRVVKAPASHADS
jgi:glycosyltransferase 2 family protein